MGTLKMSNKVNDINIKIRTYYCFNDIVSIDNNIKIDEKWKVILKYSYLPGLCLGLITSGKQVKSENFFLKSGNS